MRGITSIVIILAFAFLIGCGDSERAKKVRTEVGETWDAVKAWGVDKRADAEKFFAQNVDSLSEAYEAAKAKAKTAGGDAEETIEATWGDVSQKWTELQSAGADTWDDTRDAFVKAYESAKQRFASLP